MLKGWRMSPPINYLHHLAINLVIRESNSLSKQAYCSHVSINANYHCLFMSQHHPATILSPTARGGHPKRWLNNTDPSQKYGRQRRAVLDFVGFFPVAQEVFHVVRLHTYGHKWVLHIHPSLQKKPSHHWISSVEPPNNLLLCPRWTRRLLGWIFFFKF